jgi:anaphase-promoting complex subunit 8
MKDFDQSQQYFEDMRELDPLCLDYVDTYSNILYVKSDFAQLSFLAHEVVEIDKFRPETCCVIGNYYSLKGKRKKAILYFTRALKLDPSYLSAWTLMGHEYVELRNTASAVASYRRAVEINPKDYRAWYGLGQTYQIQQLHAFSLYYYKKAKDLRPSDLTMWCALGETYEKLNRVDEAINCFLNANVADDQDGIIYTRLANLYHHSKKDIVKAEEYYLKMLDRHANNQLTDTEQLIEGLVELARYYKNEKSDFVKAKAYCDKVLDDLEATGVFRDHARHILNQLPHI